MVPSFHFRLQLRVCHAECDAAAPKARETDFRDARRSIGSINKVAWRGSPLDSGCRYLLSVARPPSSTSWSWENDATVKITDLFLLLVFPFVPFVRRLRAGSYRCRIFAASFPRSRCHFRRRKPLSAAEPRRGMSFGRCRISSDFPRVRESVSETEFRVKRSKIKSRAYVSSWKRNGRNSNGNESQMRIFPLRTFTTNTFRFGERMDNKTWD